MKFCLLISILTVSLTAFSQRVKPVAFDNNFSFTSDKFIKTDSGIFIDHYYKKCRNVLIVRKFLSVKTDIDTAPLIIPPIFKKVNFLTIHGNVSYDFFYRSGLDDIISQQGPDQHLDQHTERIYLNISVKEKYPLIVAFALRQSYSPYFKNFADINFQFDRFEYLRNLKQCIINKLPASLNNRPDINTLKALAEDKEKQYLQLKGWLESPVTLQKIIEERERQYAQQQQGRIANTPAKQVIDSITGKTTFAGLYQYKKEQEDSLSKQIKVLYEKLDSIKNNVQKNFIGIRQKIYKSKNQNDVGQIASDNGVDAGSPGKFENKLAAVRTFSIGRSMLNYTELTAQNISITGVNVEYNPSYYAAFAAGKIDYRFRDFLNRNANRNGQYLVLGRLGIGDPEKKALILTAFRGSKNSSAFALNDTAENSVNIIGYSLESIFNKDENTGMSIEVAKSTRPVTGNLQINKQISTLWKFTDKTNLGINIKAQTIIPETNIKFSGFYRKTGENFQSFSLFSYNTDQTAWLARAGQYLFKQKVNITGMLRRNDFTNPFTDKTFKTSTVFKSILLNVNLPKYPSLSLGYYPGSQLYIVNKEKINENAYYILNGSLVHSYFYRGISMNSSLVYNQYFNKATDSGFVLYKGSAWYGSQTIFLKKLQLQACYSYNDQPELKYSSIEASGDYSLKQNVKITIGTKYNKIYNSNGYWGEKVQLEINFKQLGRLQFQYEKSYLPTISKTLYAIEIGRVSWSKYF